LTEKPSITNQQKDSVLIKSREKAVRTGHRRVEWVNA
jgi:hypothetical protein